MDPETCHCPPEPVSFTEDVEAEDADESGEQRTYDPRSSELGSVQEPFPRSHLLPFRVFGSSACWSPGQNVA